MHVCGICWMAKIVKISFEAYNDGGRTAKRTEERTICIPRRTWDTWLYVAKTGPQYSGRGTLTSTSDGRWMPSAYRGRGRLALSLYEHSINDIRSESSIRGRLDKACAMAHNVTVYMYGQWSTFACRRLQANR